MKLNLRFALTAILAGYLGFLAGATWQMEKMHQAQFKTKQMEVLLYSEEADIILRNRDAAGMP